MKHWSISTNKINHMKEHVIVDWSSQKKILDAKISIVGMGGLGCPASQSLLVAGIGSLHLIDNDTVSLSNLHRQPLFNPTMNLPLLIFFTAKSVPSFNDVILFIFVSLLLFTLP